MKTFFKHICLIFCIFVSFTIFAQEGIQKRTSNDVIHFKGGVKLFGEIINIDANSIYIELNNGKIVALPINTIKKMKLKNENSAVKLKFSRSKIYEFKEKGMYNSTIINFPQGQALVSYRELFSSFNRFYWRYWVVGMGLHHIYGKQHNRWLGTGLGLGFDGYQLGEAQNFLSAYIETRGYLLAKRFSPYYSVGLGYGFLINNYNNILINGKGGLFFSPSMGYRFGGSDGANFLLSLGYRLQISTFTLRDGLGPILSRKINFNRLNTNFALVF